MREILENSIIIVYLYMVILFIQKSKMARSFEKCQNLSQESLMVIAGVKKQNIHK
jgi:hypothetical protein